MDIIYLYNFICNMNLSQMETHYSLSFSEDIWTQYTLKEKTHIYTCI